MTPKAAMLRFLVLPLLGLAAFSCTSTTTDLVIPDLAYVTCAYGTYSNDADPEADGIAIYLLFKDTKSELIAFKGVPVQVTIKLYAYPLEGEATLPKDTATEQLVYEGHFVVDNSRGYHPDPENEITIPLEDIAPGNWFSWPSGFFPQVAIQTAQQGVFTCE